MTIHCVDVVDQVLEGFRVNISFEFCRECSLESNSSSLTVVSLHEDLLVLRLVLLLTRVVGVSVGRS